MRIHGYIALRGCSAATVALFDTMSERTIALASVGRTGFFKLHVDLPVASAVLYGFPGQVLTLGQVESTVKSRPGSFYEAATPATPGSFVYLNSASTYVQALLRGNPELTRTQASTLAATHLLGADVTADAPFNDGYRFTPESASRSAIDAFWQTGAPHAHAHGHRNEDSAPYPFLSAGDAYSFVSLWHLRRISREGRQS